MKLMKVMRCDDRFDHREGLCGVPMEMLIPFEHQAKINHNQTLERLNRRGGLGMNEILWILREQGSGDQKLLPQNQAYEELCLEILSWVKSESSKL